MIPGDERCILLILNKKRSVRQSVFLNYSYSTVAGGFGV